MEFWSEMLNLHEDNTSWKAACLVVELCFWTPISNAMLEQLFSHMNFVKTTVPHRLSNDCFNSVLRIRFNGISMQTFHNVYVHKSIQYWYDKKNGHLQPKKLKAYKKREKNKKITF